MKTTAQTKADLWDYIFMTRPILLVPVWVFMLLGYHHAGGKRFFVSGDFLYVLAGYSMLLAALYVFNQLFDVKSDAINQKHLPIAEGIVPARHAYVFGGCLLTASLVMTMRLPFTVIFFYGLSMLCGILYSLPPVKLKARPVVDFLVNAVGYGSFNFALGWMTVRPASREMLYESLPYVLAVAAIFINTTILDLDGDRKSGYLTTGVFLGQRRALGLSIAMIAACAAVSVWRRDLICLIPSAVAVPLFIYAAVSGKMPAVKRSIRLSSPLLILAAGVIFPYFLALFLAVLIFLRWYYRRRFGIDYPSVGAEA